MIALTGMWVLMLAVAVVLAILGNNAGSLSYDRPGLPPSSVLAGIYYACSGVALAVGVVIIGVQVGVRALRWYLDPTSRDDASVLAPDESRSIN